MNSTPPPGRFGYDMVSNAVAQTGTWFAITALVAVVWNTLTEVGPYARQGSIASLPLPVGATIYGAFTNFTLTSGAVIAYRSRNIIANP
jgi:hypothetical protein